MEASCCLWMVVVGGVWAPLKGSAMPGHTQGHCPAGLNFLIWRLEQQLCPGTGVLPTAASGATLQAHNDATTSAPEYKGATRPCQGCDDAG